MNKCILKHNTVKSIPPPFACQIQSSKISDLGPLISFWPSRLPWELQRWRELATASTPPSSCRTVLTGTRMPDPETCCASCCQPWQRKRCWRKWETQQGCGQGSRAQAGEPLGGLKRIYAAQTSCDFGKREPPVMTSGVKITLSKERLWSVRLRSKISRKYTIKWLIGIKGWKLFSTYFIILKRTVTPNRALNPMRHNYWLYFSIFLLRLHFVHFSWFQLG